MFVYSETTVLFPVNLVILMSTRMDVNSTWVKIEVLTFPILPPIDRISDFENTGEWIFLVDGLDSTVADPTNLFGIFEIIYKWLHCIDC